MAKGFDVTDLQETRLRLAKTANRRLRSLEKAGLDYYAYDVATLYTQSTRGRNRFSESRTALTDIKSLLNEISKLNTFLNSKSSTIRGQRSIQQNKINAFKNKGYSMENPRELYNFFESEQFKNAKGITSDFLVDYFLRGREKGVDEQELYDALDRFNESETMGADELFNEVGLNILESD